MTVHKWIWPLVLVLVVICLFSLRQLSDPDLGFHLKYGKWIVMNRHVPFTDMSTYTVAEHPYIDLHWFFQIVLYGVFCLAGYPGISIFVCILSISLSLLLLFRLRHFKVPPTISCFVLFAAFLIIEPRIEPRPEMFTFLFLTCILIILDLYAERKRNLLFLIPGIMLVWCNMHALFILGLAVLSVYFISILIHERKTDKSFAACLVMSLLICLLNPYGIKGFYFPVELLTRFDPNNIFNQHILEFIPFFAQNHFFLRDYLFTIFLLISAVFTMCTFANRKLHEVALLVLFGFLAIDSIRNIPIFIIVAVPIISRQAVELSGKVRINLYHLRNAVYFLVILSSLVMIPQLITNTYYVQNNSFNKTGVGIDRSHQPALASDFLLKNHLKGRILNSIGFGGWLSWTLPQPVFIDGRLEVMQEPIYRELTDSWNGGLPELISKYQPRLIIYNYLKYYPWTLQLKEMGNWRLIYIDEIAAIFASEEYAGEIPALDLSNLPSFEELESRKITGDWLSGFYRKTDYASISLAHQAMFREQMKSAKTREAPELKSVAMFNSANLKCKKGDFFGALADYDSAIMLQPAYSKAYNNRGILRASAFKDYAGAITDFDKAIESDPGYADAYLGRGTAFLLLHDVTSACSNWKRAQELGNVQAASLIESYCNH